jgi:hypothetical protein
MRPLQILLVEDNPGDVYLVQKVLRESTLPLHVTVIENGEQALAFVRRSVPYAEAVRPDLILLVPCAVITQRVAVAVAPRIWRAVWFSCTSI